MTKDEALKLALEALDGLSEPYDVLKAQEAIREALAQPEQEPVIDRSAAVRIATALGWEPKRTWQRLTDEEIALICGECAASAHKTDDISYARAIEAKLKEKNT